MLQPEDILNRTFPTEEGTVHPDLLGGYEDFSYGRAVEYFATLTEEERGLVHWYGEQGILPEYGCERYAIDLALGYTIVDPERKSSGGVLSAVQELNRLERFVDLYLESDGFFPRLVEGNISVFDENNRRIGGIDTLGWQSYMLYQGDGAEARDHQGKVVIEAAKNFILDPTKDQYGLFTAHRVRQYLTDHGVDDERPII